MFKNWKTTVGGFLMAAGVALSASDNHTVSITGKILMGAAGILIGAAAKDHSVQQ